MNLIKTAEAVTIGPSIFPPSNTFPTLNSLLNIIFPNLLLFAGFALFILAVLSGVGIIRSAGSGDAEGAAKGKKTLTYALAGFAIIFTSYWVIRLIEFFTGIEILQPTGFGL